MTKETFLAILRSEIGVSLGVTEPAAVALAAATASSDNDIDVREIVVTASPNIVKNCMTVGVPGMAARGLRAAAALGAVGGRMELGLRVLEGADGAAVSAAESLLADDRVRVELADDGELLSVDVRCAGTRGTGRCVIRGAHDRVVLVERDGQAVFRQDDRGVGSGGSGTGTQDAETIAAVPLARLVDLVEAASASELAFLREAADLNLRAAAYGLEHAPGMGAGAGLRASRERGSLPDSLLSDLQIHTAAAADVRVSGCPVPVATCAGSGNHGIAAFVPVARAAERLGADETTARRALALSAAVTVFVKHHSGKLSAMCGCGVASGTGVACALVLLRGGRLRAIEGAVANMAATLTGMICDGAKEGCSLKLVAAVSAAWTSAELALDGRVAPDDNGILAPGAEATISRMG